MLRAGRQAGATGRGDGQRHRDVAAEHELQLRGLVVDLVERDADEVHEHQVADRTQPACGGADTHPDEAHLGDRRVDDPLLAVGVEQAVEGVEDAAVAGDVLADHDDVGVLGHELQQRLVEGLDIRDLAHRQPFTV